MKQKTIFAAIVRERKRQDSKHKENTCANPKMCKFKKAAILSEEVGEVSKAVVDDFFKKSDVPQIRNELIQTAAVCVAWLESLPPK